MLTVLTVRYVLDPGDPTMLVVVAVVIGVLVRPGVTVVPLRSAHEQCTSVLTAALVVTLRRSLVDASNIIKISGRHPKMPPGRY